MQTLFTNVNVFENGVFRRKDITISDEHAYNGYKSIKVSSPKQPGAWIRFRILATEDMVGKTITVKCRVLLPEDEIVSHLLLNDSMKSQVRVYSNPNEFTEVTLTTTILADTTTIDFNFGMQTAALIYLDNFIANIQ